MRTKTRSLIVVSVAVVVGASILGAQDNQAKKTGLRVGVYDSRAVAIAFVQSRAHNEILKRQQAKLKTAEAEGNPEKIKELNEWGKAQQARRHLQGFGTEPVADILEQIKDRIPGIAKEAGVDLIVSKWQIDFQCPDANVVDVTDLMIRPFEPGEKALRSIRQIKDKAPLPRAQIEKHPD